MTSADKPSPPSPPWFGGLILGCLTLATAWILTYTLAPLPGQNALGGWNYIVVGLLLTFFIGLSMEWHGDPPEKNEREAEAAKAARGPSDGSPAGTTT